MFWCKTKVCGSNKERWLQREMVVFQVCWKNNKKKLIVSCSNFCPSQHVELMEFINRFDLVKRNAITKTGKFAMCNEDLALSQYIYMSYRNRIGLGVWVLVIYYIYILVAHISRKCRRFSMFHTYCRGNSSHKFSSLDH